MTLIKLKDILSEVVPDKVLRTLTTVIDQRAEQEALEVKAYLTQKAKELDTELKGKKLFKEYLIQQIIISPAGGDNFDILMGIKPAGGKASDIIPIKLHAYGKKYNKTLSSFEFTDSAWKTGQFLEPLSQTKELFLSILQSIYGNFEETPWESKNVKFVTPAGEKLLKDFGESDEIEGSGATVTGTGTVRQKDFEKLSTDDIISQIDNWSKIKGTAAFRDLQQKIASKRI